MNVSAAILNCVDEDIERCQVLSQQPKKTRSLAHLIFHWALWSALVAGLISSGLPRITHQVRAGRLGPIDPLHSIDRYLWGVGSNQSAQLMQMLSALPEGGTVVIFMGEEDDGQLAGEAMSYLAWPHPVRMLFTNDLMTEAKFGQIRPDSIALIAFCNTDPPAWFS